MRAMHRKRVLILSAVGLFLSGCFVSSYLKITDRRTWEPGEKLLAEKKYPELSASLKALNAELHPPVRRPEGALTDFGDLVMKLGRNGVLPEVKSARAALGDRTKRPEALAASARARAALGWLDGLPLEGLRDEALSPRAVATARDELEKAEAELSALAARQVALLNEDEAAGRTALALYGWLRLPVQSPDEAALRGRKIHAFSRELALLTSGSYALVAGEGAPPAYREYLHEGQRRALRVVGNARFVVPGEADAVVTLSGAEPRVNRSS